MPEAAPSGLAALAEGAALWAAEEPDGGASDDGALDASLSASLASEAGPPRSLPGLRGVPEVLAEGLAKEPGVLKLGCALSAGPASLADPPADAPLPPPEFSMGVEEALALSAFGSEATSPALL